MHAHHLYCLYVAAAAAIPRAASAHPAWGIVVDSRGNVFYSDLKQVWMLDPAGRTSIVVPDVHTHELYLDAHDTLYGEHLWYEGEKTDKWGHRVWKRTRDGKIVEVIPATEGFRTNYSFIRDAAGNMYWAGDDTGNENGARMAIHKRSPDGRVSKLATGFRGIRQIAVTPDGVIYAMDRGRLQMVAPDGSWKTLASDLEQQAGVLTRVMGFVDRAAGRDPLRHAVMGLWPAANGHVYVANTGAGVVKKVSANGRVSIGHRSSAPYSPTGVTAVGDTLWILESALLRVRVVRVSPDGANRVY